MKRKLKPYIFTLTALVVGPLICFLVVWLWFLSKPVPFAYTWAERGLWPVACSTRGCVTTRDWARQYTTAEKFAELTGAKAQTPEEALTSSVRQHLLAHAFFKSPVTFSDARRYREQVLNVNKVDFLQEKLGLTGEEYDEFVILPFLEQEALRQEQKVESTDELYRLLAKDRFILLLSWQYRWDRQAGKAVGQ